MPRKHYAICKIQVLLYLASSSKVQYECIEAENFSATFILAFANLFASLLYKFFHIYILNHVSNAWIIKIWI
jgi:hypothetical protein